jgi:hypothetical protein
MARMRVVVYNNKGGRFNFSKIYEVDEDGTNADELEEAIDHEYDASKKSCYNYSFAKLNEVNEIMDADMACNFVGRARPQKERESFHLLLKVAWRAERNRFEDAT